MRRFWSATVVGCLALVSGGIGASPISEFSGPFNGKDLTGWVNVNTAEDTWRVENGVLAGSGHPTSAMRTIEQYENFVLHVKQIHIGPSGNSGMFPGSGPRANPGSPFPDGVEMQMLELEWPNLHKKDGVTPPLAYVHGELFGAGKVETVPDNPRGKRSISIGNRCQGHGEWNAHVVMAVDGVIKLAVSGKSGNGVTSPAQTAREAE